MSLDLTHSFCYSMWFDVMAWILTATVTYTFSPSSYNPQAGTTVSHQFHLEWCERYCRVLMMRTPASSSAIPPQLEPKHGFWVGTRSTDWWERPLQANPGNHGENQLLDDSNNAGLECWMHSAGYIDVTKLNRTNQILGQMLRTWRRTNHG